MKSSRLRKEPSMRTRWIFLAFVWLAWSRLIGPEACAALLSIDEAVELSARTGRPIFAVAGADT